MTENEEHLLSVASSAEITISKIYFDENGKQINLRPIQHTYTFRKENKGKEMLKKQIEQRKKALARSCGICPVCGGSIYQYGTPQYAHAIGNTEVNRKKYGSFFIDSTYNGCLCCSLACNASIDVGKSKGKILEKLVEILANEIKDFNGGQL